MATGNVADRIESESSQSKGVEYVVARHFSVPLLNTSAWTCLELQLHAFNLGSVPCYESFQPSHWGGFITTGFRPVFSPTGFIALFLQSLENGSKNFQLRVVRPFLVPGFSALFVYNVITQKEQ